LFSAWISSSQPLHEPASICRIESARPSSENRLLHLFAVDPPLPSAPAPLGADAFPEYLYQQWNHQRS
jgi:hypothetical protein